MHTRPQLQTAAHLGFSYHAAATGWEGRQHTGNDKIAKNASVNAPKSHSNLTYYKAHVARKEIAATAALAMQHQNGL